MLKDVPARQLVSKFGTYFCVELLNAALPFLLLPVLTRFLSPTDYGIVAMFQLLVLLATPIFGLSVQGAVNRQYFERQHLDFPQYIGNCLYVLMVSSLLITALVYFFRSPLAAVASFPVDWLWSVVLVAFCRFFIMLVVILWQVRMMAFQYGTYQVALTSLNLLLSILFVVYMGMDWRGRIEAQVWVHLIFAFIAIYFLFKEKWIRWKLNVDYIRHGLAYGLPLIPHALGGWVISMVDRLFITKMVGLADTGIYAVGYQIGMVTGLIGIAFNRVWAPWFLEKIKDNDPGLNRKIVIISYVYFAGMLLLVFLMSVAAPWIIGFFVGKEFNGSTIYVFWIACGYAFDAMYRVVVQYILHVQKTVILAYVTGITALLNIVLNYLFIRMNGPVGAAQATTISFAISFLLTWTIAARLHPMPYNIFKLFTWSPR